jgi:cytochrome P450 family 142 subfamily A polypeptide 1
VGSHFNSSEINILDRDLYQNGPFETLAWIRNNQPVFRDGRGLWMLSKLEDVRWAERQQALFSNAVNGSRPNGTAQPSMIDADDPDHARQRRIVARGFTPRQMAAYEGHVATVVRQLVDAVVTKGSCDIVTDIAKPLPMTLIGEMLGAPESDYERLQSWSDRMIAGSDGPENVTEDVMTAALDYYAYISEVIEQRKSNPGDDLVSKFVTALEDGDDVMDDAHVIGNALLLLVGGNETTRNVIAGGIEALIRRPEQLRYAQASPENLERTVEEALRWVTPIISMNRTTTQDVTLRDVVIPEGSQVLMHYLSANRDEEVFERPDEFDASRHPNPHISFGWGPHLCLGANLARLELRSAYREIFTRLTDLRFLEDDYEPTYSHSSFVRGIQSLPVTFTVSR